MGDSAIDAAAHANLLCAEEADHTHDAQARGDDYYQASTRAKVLQQKVPSIRLRQAHAVEAQRLVDLELAQATEACEAASDDAVRISEAGAVRKAVHIDEVWLCQCCAWSDERSVGVGRGFRRF